MSHETPEDNEVWQDAEGMLFYIVDGGKRALTFGSPVALWIEHLDPMDKPSERIFDQDGKYVGSGDRNVPDLTQGPEEYRAEVKARQERYDERCRAAGLVGDDTGSTHEMVLVELGPDGPRPVDPADPDVPDVVRRMVNAAQDAANAEVPPNSFGSPRGPFG